ncbi:Toluene-4-monooxygenase system protein D [Mycobacterium numidiamassiliense]|uniref:Toluene-4-monooxygenase system protein D n=1 Tax=Mycobacterium numidiamassiliense TaxID=1841861 RepID=A0A2U3PG43_9MYCO|nr:MmoB/DmpM family protein [Mycobacterium numidiamassiliense]SPM42718.1 Toluene-4-monooxygenase system protein D [Mycobacterium numidiamassiliense]
MTPSTAERKLVGPIVRGVDSDVVDALTEAIRADNPEADILVEDHAGYVRIHAPSFLRVTRSSLEWAAGEPIPLASLEPAIAGFAGRMRYVGDDELHWYLERED